MSELQVNVVPRGPGPELFEQARSLVQSHADVRAELGDRHRLLALEFLEDDSDPLGLSDHLFRATFYDYSNNRPLVVEASLRAAEVTVTIPNIVPRPNSEEFEDAVAILHDHPELGDAVRGGALRTYRPMPPLVHGVEERTLAVGLLPEQDGSAHEIVGVNMTDRSVVRYEDKAPPASVAHNPICGLPGLYQPTTSRGVPGQAEVTVFRHGTLLWRFLVVRPAASSGIDGSGIELRNLTYRGRPVLKRAHVPILNVLYDGNVCGPYRDWQWEEGMFEADGSDVAPGIRWCAAPARTILDSARDHGNFRGVALYTAGQEVVLVSELEAGWYRYISEWRLHEDGTIRPRFGFSAVKNSCVCTTHHHHVYWRLDFDVDATEPNRVEEFNDPPLAGLPPWQPHAVEIKRLRDPSHSRRWRVANTLTGAGYTIVPGEEDGIADAYGRGDTWILRYRATEIDDGHWWTTGTTEANLDKYVNGEVVEGGDIVFWYAAHFTHHQGADERHGHRLGPDLTPHNWIGIP